MWPGACLQSQFCQKTKPAKTDFATKFGIQVICKQKSATDPSPKTHIIKKFNRNIPQ
jgi:hypothetical protein